MIQVLKIIVMALVDVFMPKKLGVKLIIFLLEWAAKKTKWTWDDELVAALKKAV